MLEAQSDDSDKDLMELHNELLKQVMLALSLRTMAAVSHQHKFTSGSSVGTCSGQASALKGEEPRLSYWGPASYRARQRPFFCCTADQRAQEAAPAADEPPAGWAERSD